MAENILSNFGDSIKYEKDVQQTGSYNTMYVD